MLSKLKSHFWWIVGGIVVLFVLVLLKDANRAQELAAFFRQKKVEDDVNVIKEVISKKEGDIKVNDEEIVKLTEQYNKEKGSAKEASEEEIYRFYQDFFSK